MLIGSLVELHVLLYSYLCFSLLEKQFLSYLDTSSIPPRHLAIYRAYKIFLIAISTDPRQLGGSIKKVPGPSIASRQLVDQLSFSFVSLLHSLTDSSTPLDTSICRELLKLYILVCCDPVLISLISLDLSTHVHLSNHSLSLQTSFPSVFQAFSRISLQLVSFNSLIFMHFIL